MRRYAVPLAVVLAIAGSVPALAGGGVPKIATLQAGPYAAAVYNDSPTLLTGRNALTVEIPALPAGHLVNLTLQGPAGQYLEVPLQPVLVLAGPDGGHGADSHDDGPDDHAVTPGSAVAAPVAGAGSASSGAHSHDQKATAAHDHGTAAATAEHGADQDDHEAGGFLARGIVSIPSTGLWQVQLIVRGEHGQSYVARQAVQATEGGPNLLYVAGAGSLLGGFLLYGVVERRRQSISLQKAR